MRLDRFICKHTEHGHQTARRLVVAGRVRVAGQVITDPRHAIDRFVEVSLNGELLQGRPSHYLMLHKPEGYLSATADPRHPTVMELLPAALRDQLHIGGRLDRATTGLLILTNDGHWSRRLTEPGKKVPKVYRVQTAHAIGPDTADRFAAGIHFAYEGITTSPAQLELLGENEARLVIYEGRYHQVKRMFHQVGNRVVALHREQMGEIALDAALAPGQYRPLTPAEIASVG